MIADVAKQRAGWDHCNEPGESRDSFPIGLLRLPSRFCIVVVEETNLKTRCIMKKWRHWQGWVQAV